MLTSAFALPKYVSFFSFTHFFTLLLTFQFSVLRQTQESPFHRQESMSMKSFPQSRQLSANAPPFTNSSCFAMTANLIRGQLMVYRPLVRLARRRVVLRARTSMILQENFAMRIMAINFMQSMRVFDSVTFSKIRCQAFPYLLLQSASESSIMTKDLEGSMPRSVPI